MLVSYVCLSSPLGKGSKVGWRTAIEPPKKAPNSSSSAMFHSLLYVVIDADW